MEVERIISEKKKQQVKENDKIKKAFKRDLEKVKQDLKKVNNINQLTKAVEDLSVVVDRVSRMVFGEGDITL